MVSAKPAIIELDIDKLEQILRRLDAKELDAEDYETIKAVLGSYVYLFFEELIRQAAQGNVVHNDDTGVKILEVMAREHDKRLWPRRLSTPQGQMRIKAAAKAPPRVCRKKSKAERTGTFTSGIVAIGEGRRIALFFSGRQHAGENLEDVLAQRAAGLPPPIQMCDALARNLPGELQTILANCLAHGRRQFVDVAQQRWRNVRKAN